MIAERIWAMRRIPKPVRKEGSISEGPAVDFPFKADQRRIHFSPRLTNLGFSISYCRDDNPNGKHSDAHDLHGRIALSPDEAN